MCGGKTRISSFSTAHIHIQKPGRAGMISCKTRQLRFNPENSHLLLRITHYSILKLILTHAKKLDEVDEGRYPTNHTHKEEEEIEPSLLLVAYVELVDSPYTEEPAQKRCSQFTFHNLKFKHWIIS